MKNQASTWYFGPYRMCTKPHIYAYTDETRWMGWKKSKFWSHPYFTYAAIEGSSQPVHMQTLA